MNNRKFRLILKAQMERKIAREVKLLGMDRVDQKHGNHPFLTPKEIKGFSKKEKVAKFIKAVFFKDTVNMKALSEGVNAAGGFQVPEEFAAEVNRVVEDFGLVRKMARKIPMVTDTMNVPRLASSVSVTFPGENTAGSETEPVWENVQLLAKTAVGLTVSSNELLADANISIVDLLVELFGEALAGEEDKQGLTGTGAPFTGILSAASVNELVLSAGNTGFTDVTADDLQDTLVLVKPWSLQGAGWIMHRTVWGVIQKLKDSSGQFLVSMQNQINAPIAGPKGPNAGVSVGTIWGYPVFLSDKMPDVASSAINTTFIIFGNLSHLWFGDRQEISMAISDAATVGSNNTFEQNQSAIRLTERYALAVGLPDAFARIKTAAA